MIDDRGEVMLLPHLVSSTLRVIQALFIALDFTVAPQPAFSDSPQHLGPTPYFMTSSYIAPLDIIPLRFYDTAYWTFKLTYTALKLS